eukprot:CFRG2646T1
MWLCEHVLVLLVASAATTISGVPTSASTPNSNLPITASRRAISGNDVTLTEVQCGSMDWVEIYNPTNQAISLNGYTLVGSEDDDIYTFTGDCANINAEHFMLIVDKDTQNPEYASDDCKLPFNIKTHGSLSLINAAGVVVDQTVWDNVAYVAGHSWAKKTDGTSEVWEATSSSTPFGANKFTEPITMPAVVDFSAGLKDRKIAYIQDPPAGSITNVHVRVFESSDSCTCNQFQEAHNDELCSCTWSDVLNDATGMDLEKIVMPCSVSVDVDGYPEFWYDNVNGAPSERRKRTEQNGNIAVRGGFTRQELIESFSIRFDKHMIPRDWRGLKRLNMVKAPWNVGGGVSLHSVFNQFIEMDDFNSLRQTVANLTVTIVDPDTGIVSRVENMGRYVMFENPDEDCMDRHGQSARDMEGDRKETHLYKLNSMDFAWSSVYDLVVPEVNEADESLASNFWGRLEPKDSKDNTKLVQTLKELNNKTDMSFVDAVHRRFDMRNLAQWVAVNIVCGDIDHMGKNQYIYSNNDTDIWYFTPWDYDACLRVVMNDGPPANSMARYQEHYLFQGIMWMPELREEFYPLLLEKINYLRGGLFSREALEITTQKYADWLEPFLRVGEVDYEVMAARKWNETDEGPANFTSDIVNYSCSPKTNFFGQYDFVQETVDQYTFGGAPPFLYQEMRIVEKNDDEFFGVKFYPMVSPVGHKLDIIMSVYKNRPDFDFDSDESIQGISIFTLRYWVPAKDDIVTSVLIDTQVSEHWRTRETAWISCDDVSACSDGNCWVTMHTVDKENGVESAGGFTPYQIQLNGTGCF